MINKTYYVYSHKRQDTGEIFYIGCATKHGRHTKRAYSRAYDFPQRTDRWRSIADAAGVEVEILKEFKSRSDAFEMERLLISKHGRTDIGTGTLTNECDGGPGAAGQVCSDETRATKSRQKLGSKNPMFGRLGKDHPKAKKIINAVTGEIFYGVPAAAKSIGISNSILYQYLDGTRQNKTSMREVM